ncbi:MAG: 50S ribosomal protein L9 [Polyangiaceae bacterium]|jgi:large subunit ribosomal protein L9|nr:50S ribosomal protein L9 [Polyangiaceae bacterium]MBK8939445.1 50S ribosomal protein L9 [Polyangiaceae bacterium]
MALHIHVVLTQDLANVGKGGELVKVRPGFARNYLIPRGLAIGATEGNIRRIEHQKKVAEAKAAKALDEASQLSKKLSSVKVTIHRQVGEGDKLYGSVTHRDIEEALATQGFVVDRRRITSDALKSLGTHAVQIRLAPTVTATIQVEVAAKA